MCAVVRLDGCSATPFGSYLKALGVLRLVSEQKDSEARGWWNGDVFILDSILDDAGLEEFFLEQYRPTPIVAPWNGGSGFYPKDNKKGIDAIARSTAERFSSYRQAIAMCRDLPDVQRGKIEKDAKAEDARRTAILLSCRNELPDSAVEWLDAAVGISASGTRAFAPVLGTGGNEGRLDYTNNFMSRLAGLLICPDRKAPVRELLRNALFCERTEGLQSEAAGQYDPGRAGGANQGQGVAHDSATNPWDFVLTLEGAVCWASGLYRRHGISYRSSLCSPFTVSVSKVGYGSASADEEARAEIWAPLWSRKTRYAELRILLREGRATVGGTVARNGLEFAEAAAGLGVDRSIDRFVRYSLLKRRGDSYVALPAGTFPVRYRAESDRVREIGSIAERISRQDIPKDCDVLQRRLEQAMYEALLRNGKHRVRGVLTALGRLLRNVVTRSTVELPQTSSSGPEWMDCCDTCIEVRIAAALASLYDNEAGSILSNLQRASDDFAWQGRDLADRLVTVLDRRLRLYSWDGSSRPFAGSVRLHAADITVFIEGGTDDTLIEDLLFAFLCFDWKTGAKLNGEQANVLPVYAALKYLFLPEPVLVDGEEKRLRADSRIPALLRAGDVERAADIAVHRLSVAGLLPYRRKYPGLDNPIRLGAALLIPAWDFAQAILPAEKQSSAKA